MGKTTKLTVSLLQLASGSVLMLFVKLTVKLILLRIKLLHLKKYINK